MAPDATTQAPVPVQDVRRQAVEYRLLGATPRQIADKLGISVAEVRKYVREALRGKGDRRIEDGQEFLRLQLVRLDSLLFGLMGAARTGDSEAIRRVREIQNEQQAIEAGVPVAVVAAIMGHSGLRTIHRYVHPTGEAQKTAMENYEAAQQRRKLKVVG